MNLNTFGGISSIIGLIITVLSWFFSDTGISIWSLSTAVIICILIVIFLCQGNKSMRYANGLKTIQIIHKEVLKHYNGYKNKSLGECTAKLSEVCSKVSKAFSTMKGTEISVCIKYINCKDDEYYVKTLCRDGTAMNNREKMDEATHKTDKINDNSDFRFIFEKYNETKAFDGIYYFSNYLPFKHQYNNTHLDTSKITDNFLTRIMNWPLPYKSTIVVPIISNIDGVLYGFLCIDSLKIHGFDEKQDVDILQNVALFLGATIKLISEQSLKQ